MKKYFMLLALTFSMLHAYGSSKRGFEYFVGYHYTLANSFDLYQRMPESIDGFGGTAGLYLPAQYPFAISFGVGGVYESASHETSTVSESGTRLNMYLSLLVMYELDAHRFGLGMTNNAYSEYTYSKIDLTNYSIVESIDTAMKENILGYIVSYEYNFAKSSPLSIGIEYNYIPFKDIQGNAYPEHNIRAIIKLKLVTSQPFPLFFP